jgi:hypothetical protein
MNRKPSSEISAVEVEDVELVQSPLSTGWYAD